MGLEANELPLCRHGVLPCGDSGSTGGQRVTPSPRRALTACATSLLQGHQERQGAAQQEGGAHSPGGRHLRGKDPALTKQISPGLSSLRGEVSPPAPCWGGCGLGLAPCPAPGASPGLRFQLGVSVRPAFGAQPLRWFSVSSAGRSSVPGMPSRCAPTATYTSPLFPCVSWGPRQHL